MILVTTGLGQSKTGKICRLCIVTVRVSEAIVEFRVCKITVVLNDELMLMEAAYIVALLI